MEKSSNLADKVRKALEEDPRTREATIDVVDESGLVTLTGTVAEEEVRQAAEEIAGQQEGVIEVVNDLALEEEDELAGDVPVVAPPAQDLHGSLLSK